MARKLKVYQWQGHRGSVGSTREVAAMPSKAALSRTLNISRASQLFNLAEACKDETIEEALASPGVVLWKGINDRGPFRRGEVMEEPLTKGKGK